MDLEQIHHQISSLRRRVDNLICQTFETIIDFYEYCRFIAEYKERYVILIAIKDTVKAEKLKNKKPFEGLGLTTDFAKTHHKAYAALLANGAVLFEQFGKKSSDVITFANQRYELVSKSFKFGNMASIRIDEQELAQNARGFNIVLYDPAENRLVDSVSFDIHGDSVKRKEQTISVDIANLQNALDKATPVIRATNEYVTQNFFRVYQHRNWLDDVESAKCEYFRLMPKATGLVRLNQLLMTYMLKKFDELCTATNIQYIITAGTLLGAVRHKGFIPWDDDVDLWISADDALRLLEYTNNAECLERFPDAYLPISRWRSKKLYKFGFVKFGIKGLGYAPCDIFCFTYADGNDTEFKSFLRQAKEKAYAATEQIFGYNCFVKDTRLWLEYAREHLEIIKDHVNANGGKEWLIHRVFSTHEYIKRTDEIFPLKRVEFETLQLYAPQSCEKRLESKFGDYNKLPFDIHTHKHRKLTDDLILPKIEYIQQTDTEFYECYMKEELQNYLKDKAGKQ